MARAMATALWRKGPRAGRPLHWVAVFLSLTLALVVLTLLSAQGRACSPNRLLDADLRQVEHYFTPKPQDTATLHLSAATHFAMLPRPELCDPAPDLLILVPTPPHDGHVRDVIRQTWGSAVGGAWPHAEATATRQRKVALVFLVGMETERTQGEVSATSVRQEAERHGDVLVVDVSDTYRNLVHKILHGLRWAARHCAAARFVLKADADSFVDVDRLLSLLFDTPTPWPGSGVVLGDILCAEPVSRDPSSRVHVEVGLYPFPSYPVYARGGTYVLSGDLLGPLVNSSSYLPVLPPEDAYITGVLGRVLKVRHVHLPGIMQAVICPLSPCVFLLNGQLTATDVDTDLMRAMWETVQAGPGYCSDHATMSTRMCSWLSMLTVRCRSRVGLVS